MIKRILILVTALLSLNAPTKADDFTLGNATFSIPEGWTKVSGTDGRLTFAASDGKQQATISLIRFGAMPSFEDFERICSHRYDAEKNGATNLSLTPDKPDPRAEDGKFIMSFTGREVANGRIFSGLLSLKNRQLITVYLEGVGVDVESNRGSFSEIVTSLKQ